MCAITSLRMLLRFSRYLWELWEKEGWISLGKFSSLAESGGGDWFRFGYRSKCSNRSSGLMYLEAWGRESSGKLNEKELGNNEKNLQ